MERFYLAQEKIRFSAAALQKRLLNIMNTLCRCLSAAMEWDSESVQSEDVFKQPENPGREPRPLQPSTPQNQGGVRPHEFVSKTVCARSLARCRRGQVRLL